jgi:hypothetical protein
MIGVDKIGEIRRAYFEQHRSIKEIVRTLSVSRATVRKVVRGPLTEFKYERGVQPSPKLGDWVEALTEILEKEAKLPKRERRSTQRLFEELRGRGYDGAHDSVHRFVKAWRDGCVTGPSHHRIVVAGQIQQTLANEWVGLVGEFSNVPRPFFVKLGVQISFTKGPEVALGSRRPDKGEFAVCDRRYSTLWKCVIRGASEDQPPSPNRPGW